MPLPLVGGGVAGIGTIVGGLGDIFSGIGGLFDDTASDATVQGWYDQFAPEEVKANLPVNVFINIEKSDRLAGWVLRDYLPPRLARLRSGDAATYDSLHSQVNSRYTNNSKPTQAPFLHALIDMFRQIYTGTEVGGDFSGGGGGGGVVGQIGGALGTIGRGLEDLFGGGGGGAAGGGAGGGVQEAGIGGVKVFGIPVGLLLIAGLVVWLMFGRR